MGHGANTRPVLADPMQALMEALVEAVRAAVAADATLSPLQS